MKGEKAMAFKVMIEGSKTKIISTCPSCGKVSSLMVDTEDLKTWLTSSKPIQRVFTYLSPEECELMISGLCSECWDKLFKVEEE
jgi:hypothetical protein